MDIFLRDLKAQSEGLKKKKAHQGEKLRSKQNQKWSIWNGLIFTSPREFLPFSRSNVLQLTCAYFSTFFYCTTHSHTHTHTLHLSLFVLLLSKYLFLFLVMNRSMLVFGSRLFVFFFWWLMVWSLPYFSLILSRYIDV